MQRSFGKGSAIYDLLAEADGLKPDYSGKADRLDDDVMIGPAPDCIGKLLALRVRYLQKAEAESSESLKKAYRKTQALIEAIMSSEIDRAVLYFGYDGDTVLRKSGIIVAVACRKSSVTAAENADAVV